MVGNEDDRRRPRCPRHSSGSRGDKAITVMTGNVIKLQRKKNPTNHIKKHCMLLLLLLLLLLLDMSSTRPQPQLDEFQQAGQLGICAKGPMNG